MSLEVNNYQYVFNEAALPGIRIDTRGTAGIPGKDDDRKIFVGGLVRKTTERQLRDYFGNYGVIESIMMKRDRYIDQSRAYAFIVFQDAKSVEKVLSLNHYIDRKKVSTKPVVKKVKHGKIFVGGLTPAITNQDIRNYFSQYGTVVEIQAPFDKVKNQRKGVCFVTFDNRDVIYQVLKTPNPNIMGKRVHVKKVKLNPKGVVLNPNITVISPNMPCWEMKPPFSGTRQPFSDATAAFPSVRPPFAGGYPPEFPAACAAPAYNYGEYGPPNGNDYFGCSSTNAGPTQPHRAKSRGPARPFHRYRPY